MLRIEFLDFESRKQSQVRESERDCLYYLLTVSFKPTQEQD